MALYVNSVSHKLKSGRNGNYIMDYVSKFIAAMSFAGEIDPNRKVNNNRLVEIEKYYRELMKNRELRLYVNNVVSESARQCVRGAPFSLADQCHNISQTFFERSTSMGLTEFCGMAVTVGDVVFKGKRIYGATPESVKEVIHKGFAPEEPLNLHVWITLANMTVVDLAIIPTLVSKGVATTKDFKGKDIVVWKESKGQSLEYIPILHDDNFLYKVDKIKDHV
jgi:hypothetical protein